LRDAAVVFWQSGAQFDTLKHLLALQHRNACFATPASLARAVATIVASPFSAAAADAAASSSLGVSAAHLGTVGSLFSSFLFSSFLFLVSRLTSTTPLRNDIRTHTHAHTHEHTHTLQRGDGESHASAVAKRAAMAAGELSALKKQHEDDAAATQEAQRLEGEIALFFRCPFFFCK
jgi:hypothetical protein